MAAPAPKVRAAVAITSGARPPRPAPQTTPVLTHGSTKEVCGSRPRPRCTARSPAVLCSLAARALPEILILCTRILEALNRPYPGSAVVVSPRPEALETLPPVLGIGWRRT